MIFEYPQVLLLWTAFFFLVVWLPAVFAPAKFVKAIEKMTKNEDTMRTRWVITLLFGLGYLTVYQAIDGSRGLLFSLFGYLCLLKGLRLIRIPSYAMNKFKMAYNTPGKSIIIGIAILICSILFAWIALAKI